MKKAKIITLLLIAIVVFGGIVYAGVDAYYHQPADAIMSDSWDDVDNYYFRNEDGTIDTIPKSQTITQTEGYFRIENGKIVEFEPAEDVD